MTRATYTVLGGGGFIGRRLIESLRAGGVKVYAPLRSFNNDPLDDLRGRSLALLSHYSEEKRCFPARCLPAPFIA